MMKILKGRRIFFCSIAVVSVGLSFQTTYNAALSISVAQLKTASLSSIIDNVSRLQSDIIQLSLTNKSQRWNTLQNAQSHKNFERTLSTLRSSTPAELHVSYKAVKDSWNAVLLAHVPRYQSLALSRKHHTNTVNEKRAHCLALVQTELIHYLAKLQALQQKQQEDLQDTTENFIKNSLITPFAIMLCFQLVLPMMFLTSERCALAASKQKRSRPQFFDSEQNLPFTNSFKDDLSAVAFAQCHQAMTQKPLNGILDDTDQEAEFHTHQTMQFNSNQTVDQQHTSLTPLTQALTPASKILQGVHEKFADVQDAARAALAAVSREEDHLRQHFVSEQHAIQSTILRVREHALQLHTGSDQMSTILSNVDDIVRQMGLLAIKARVKAASVGEAGKVMAIITDAVVKLSEQSIHHSKSLNTLVEHFKKESQNALTHADVSSKAIADNSARALQSAVQLGAVRSDVQALIAELEMISPVPTLVTLPSAVKNEA